MNGLKGLTSKALFAILKRVKGFKARILGIAA